MRKRIWLLLYARPVFLNRKFVIGFNSLFFNHSPHIYKQSISCLRKARPTIYTDAQTAALVALKDHPATITSTPFSLHLYHRRRLASSRSRTYIYSPLTAPLLLLLLLHESRVPLKQTEIRDDARESARIADSRSRLLTADHHPLGFAHCSHEGESERGNASPFHNGEALFVPAPAPTSRKKISPVLRLHTLSHTRETEREFSRFVTVLAPYKRIVTTRRAGFLSAAWGVYTVMEHCHGTTSLADW